MKLRTVLAALALTLAGTAAAYNIKDTLQPFSVYTGSNTTPSIQAATNGQVTLGPVNSTQNHAINGNVTTTGTSVFGASAGLGTSFNQTNGSMISRMTSASSNGLFGAVSEADLTVESYMDASSAYRAVATTTGYSRFSVLRSTAVGSNAFEFRSNYQDAQTAGAALTSTNEALLGKITAGGAWTLGPVAGASHIAYGTLSVVGNSNTGGVNLLEVDNSTPALSFAVLGNSTVAVVTTNWGTGGTAIGVSAGKLTTSPSSLRYKKDVAPLAGEIDTTKIFDLTPVVFTYKVDNKRSFGLIAEDTYTKVPSLVWREPDADGALQPESIAYDHLSVLVLAELKKLRTEFNAYRLAHP